VRSRLRLSRLLNSSLMLSRGSMRLYRLLNRSLNESSLRLSSRPQLKRSRSRSRKMLLHIKSICSFSQLGYTLCTLCNRWSLIQYS